MEDPNQGVYTEVLYINTVGKAKQALSFTRDFYEKFLPPAGTTNLEWDVSSIKPLARTPCWARSAMAGVT